MVIDIKKLKVSTLIIIDFLCICLGFGLFCLFHFVIDFSGDTAPVSLITSVPQAAPATATISQQASETEAVAEEPVHDDGSEEYDQPVRNTSGMFGEKFAEMFTVGEIIQTEDSYKSENINVSVSHNIQYS